MGNVAEAKRAEVVRSPALQDAAIEESAVVVLLRRRAPASP
jgi:hypothetical protein